MTIQNPYRFHAPHGWGDSASAPHDGTVIELQNNYGIAPSFSVCKWVDGRGWVDATDAMKGVGDGLHISWRPYHGIPENYRDPTGGLQETREYWLRAAGYAHPQIQAIIKSSEDRCGKSTETGHEADVVSRKMRKSVRPSFGRRIRSMFSMWIA